MGQRRQDFHPHPSSGFVVDYVRRIHCRCRQSQLGAAEGPVMFAG